MTKTLLLILICLSTSAQARSLRPAGGDDLRVTRLAQAPVPSGEFERKPVQFAWTLDPHAELDLPPPHHAVSREYWLHTDAQHLRDGFSFDTTAEGAVIRISPAQGAAALASDQVQLLKEGRTLPAGQSFRMRSDAAQWQAQGVPNVEGSVVLQLDKGVGSGRFQLRLAQAQGRYLVHVYEPSSRYALHAQASRSTALAGETLSIGVELRDGDRVLPAELAAVLMAPDGRSFPLGVSDGRAEVVLPASASSVPGLWEVQLVAGGLDGELGIQRDVRTAFAVGQPTARLQGDYRLDASSLRFTLPVEVASAGRYQLGATLYATGPDGVARPVAIAQSAAWITPGNGALSLAFEGGQLPLGYRAPYELRHLMLSDQTRMSILETRAFALQTASRP